MKNEISRILLAVTLSSAALCGATALGQTFEQNSSLIINPDFNSGNAWGSIHGRRALVTSISSYIWTSIDTSAHAIYFHGSVTIEGVEAELNGRSPYQQFLIHQGLSTEQTWSGVTVTFNNEGEYELETEAILNVRGQAGISRDLETNELIGKFPGITSGYGMIPIHSSTSVTIYDGDIGRNPEFVGRMDFTYMVTNFHRVPTPGSLALLGLGGLAVARRRR